MSSTVLLIEDDDRLARGWARALRRDGWSVVRARSVWQAIERLDDELEVSAVVLDVDVPDGPGVSLTAWLNEQEQPARLIVVAEVDAELALALIGSVDVLVSKPVKPQVLSAIVAETSRDQTHDQVEAFAAFYGFSPTETRLMHLASHAADERVAAGVLGCEPATVRTYWKRILAKSGCHRQRDVIVKLWRYGQSSKRPWSDTVAARLRA
jgi:DNA-binding response OmpR family regulator